MFALEPQRFRPGKLDYLPTVLLGHGNTVWPLYPMGIEHQLAVGLQIVENGHFLIRDDREFLLLKGMQPAHEDVRLYSALKITSGQGRIGDMWIQVTPAVSRNTVREFAQQGQHHGNVVGSKTPQNILFGSQFAQVKTRGVDVLDLSELTGMD